MSCYSILVSALFSQSLDADSITFELFFELLDFRISFNFECCFVLMKWFWMNSYFITLSWRGKIDKTFSWLITKKICYLARIRSIPKTVVIYFLVPISACYILELSGPKNILFSVNISLKTITKWLSSMIRKAELISETKVTIIINVKLTELFSAGRW